MRCYRILLLSHLHIYCHLLQQARRPSTKKSYNSKVDEFQDFCGRVQDEADTPCLSSMPASQTTIIAFIGYLASLGRIRSASLHPYLCGINRLHADFGLTNRRKGIGFLLHARLKASSTKHQPSPLRFQHLTCCRF